MALPEKERQVYRFVEVTPTVLGPGIVGISSLTVGWICTARCITAQGAAASMISSNEWKPHHL